MPQPAGEVALRDAATVMLVRDSSNDEGIEVFMLRRNLESDFVGGAYVFPGGAVDPDDRHDDLEAVTHGRSDSDASERLDLDQGGLAFWVAAIRESFEEAGVLLAYDGDGRVVRLADHDAHTTERFVEYRRAVDEASMRLVDVCHREGLRLAVDQIYYFSHWITPEGAPRRYDTRFFVARAPEAQVPLHDNRETIAHLWIRPAEALERHAAGEFDLIFPTIRSLVSLAQFPSADALLAHAATIDDVPAILPRIVADKGGGFRIVLPDDAEYQTVVVPTLPPGVPMNKLAMSRSKAIGATSNPSSVGSLDMGNAGTQER